MPTNLSPQFAHPKNTGPTLISALAELRPTSDTDTSTNTSLEPRPGSKDASSNLCGKRLPIPRIWLCPS